MTAMSDPSGQQTPATEAALQGGTSTSQAPQITSGFTQLKAMVKKNALLKLRSPWACALETILPILFIVGLVVIWTLGANTRVEDTMFTKENTTAQPLLDYWTMVVPKLVCANTSMQKNGVNISIPGIRPCIANDTMLETFKCYKGIPVDGLCSTIDAFYIVMDWLSFDKPRYVPSMDEFLLMQWFAAGTFDDSLRGAYGTVYNGLVNLGGIHFVPDNADTRALADYMNKSSVLFKYVYGNHFPSLEAAWAYSAKNTLTNTSLAFIRMDQSDANGLDVTLSFNRSGTPWTGSIRDRFNANGLGRYTSRLLGGDGFLTIQALVEQFYLNKKHNVSLTYRPAIVPMPFKGYINSEFLNLVGTLAPLIIVFAYLYSVSQLVKRLVEEKELRIREAMMIMGLGPVPFYMSWLVTYLPQNIFTCASIAIICKYTMLPQTDGVVVFCIFFLFSISTIAFAGLLSSLFNKSRVAALASPVIFFLTTIPSFAIPGDSSAGVYVGLSFLCPTAFGVGTKLIMQYEINSGFQWVDFPNSLDKVNMGAVFALLVADILIYVALTLYFDAVMPSDWGQHKHPLFCIIEPIQYIRNRWNRDAASVPRARVVDNNKKVSTEPAEGKAARGPLVEKLNRPDAYPSISMRKLRKEFRLESGELLVAVNDLDLTLYEGDINVLLGHNGAGKTTTINLMTGMLDVDGGDCNIYGKSIVNEMDAVRQEIGFCPQHNILFDDLTCREHLEFYATLKGLQGEENEESVQDMLQAVNLEEKENVRSANLSGGQKRKLSVAIAFIGRSRVIFLDEPTAGMDVGARRFTWDLIKRMSQGRTIILTTHYMDEADLLGNTISIMAKGALCCSGSSAFLKGNLGVGYTLTVAVEQHNTAAQGLALRMVRDFIPDADIVSQTAGELAVRLPMGTVGQFPDMLEALEKASHELTLRGIGISVTTLEEIFLRIGEGLEEEDSDDEDEEAKKKKPTTAAAAATSASPQRAGEATTGETEQTPGSAPRRQAWAGGQAQPGDHSPDAAASNAPVEDENARIWAKSEQNPTPQRQLLCLLKKRFDNAKRDRRTQFLQMILPVVCIAVSMALTSVSIPVMPVATIDASQFLGGRTETVISNCPTGFENAFDNTIDVTVKNYTRAHNLSWYLINTSKAHALERLTAIQCVDSNLFPPIPAAVLFANNSGYRFTPAQVLNEYHKAILRFAKNGSTASRTDNVKMTLRTQNVPLSDKENAQFDALVTFLIGLFILIPFSFIPSTFVSFIVKERECKATHLQYVSGMNYLIYWMSNLIFDMLCFMVSVFLAFMVFLAFNRKEYIGNAENGFATLVVFLLFGLAGVGSSYAVSFLFSQHDTAQNVVMLGNFICGFLLVLIIYFLDILGSTKDAAKILRYIFRLIPSYALGEGVIALASRQFLLLVGIADDRSAFHMDVVGWPCVYLAIQGPVLIGLTLLVDHPSRQLRTQQLMGKQTPPPIENEDEDVKREREVIEGVTNAQGEVIQPPISVNERIVTVNGLRKVYPTPIGDKVAVKNLSFGIEHGEVFAFLGTNGAGKTTTISILCGEFLPTAGVCTIGGSDVVADAADARRKIGYCPQFDALHELLTPEEHLALYAGLRGVASQDIPELTERLLNFCGLSGHRGKPSRSLSGGNKRKLSVAISLIGGPVVVMLDEPSAGMDPKARRGLWTVIQGISQRCSIVLTTHHLEEVEVLASRVGIMVDGEMKCLGSLQALKTKFGSGYEVAVRFETKDAMDAGKAELLAAFTGAAVEEERNQKLTLALPADLPLSQTFRHLEDLKQKPSALVLDYSVTQSSLEQVFLRISAAAHAQQE